MAITNRQIAGMLRIGVLAYIIAAVIIPNCPLD